MLVDFHSHSNCSDGELSPQQLMQLAQTNGIRMLSITDHDTIEAYSQLNNVNSGEVQLITGIEFSSYWRKTGIHIVGLNIDLNSEALKQTVQQQQHIRRNRTQLIAGKLEKIGLKNAFEKLIQHKSGYLGRPDFAQLLVSEGICADSKQAYKKYLGAGKIGDIKNLWLNFDHIIQVITAAGGIPVLAHPLAYKLTNTQLKRLLNDAKYQGLQALEVINGYQNMDKINYLQNLCQTHKLSTSIGSDFHHPDKWSKLGVQTKLINHPQNVWDIFSGKVLDHSI